MVEPDGTVVDEVFSGGHHEEPKRVIVEVYHHFPDGIPLKLDLSKLTVDVTGAVNVTVVQATPPAPVATSAVLIIKSTTGETNMPGTITVDTTNETVTLAFTDDHGDTDAAAPSNASGTAVPTFTASDTSVITVGTGNPAAVTPVAEGTSTISVALAYPDGTPVLEADGVTPFPVPDPVSVTVTAGAAVGDSLVLSV